MCNDARMDEAQQVGSREAARILGLGQSTINTWARQGLIEPAVKFPGYKGAQLFWLSDVQRVAASRGHSPEDQPP
jgi:DNA-binding transcriptional MerR regulator